MRVIKNREQDESTESIFKKIMNNSNQIFEFSLEQDAIGLMTRRNVSTHPSPSHPEPRNLLSHSMLILIRHTFNKRTPYDMAHGNSFQ